MSLPALRGDRLLLAALLAGSAAVRIQQYTAGRSLWSDEAMLALSIALRSPRELVQPLYYDQVAPVGFLWAERLAVSVGGVNEFSLRILPLLAGIVLPFFVWRLGTRLLNRTAALIAVALVGFAPALVFYSNDAKPYGIDALITVALVRLAMKLLDRPADRSAFVKLLLAGVVAIWVSVSAVFVLAGVICALMADAGSEPSRRWSRSTLVLAWGLAFAGAYFTVYGRGAVSPYMQAFWQGTYLDIHSLDGIARSVLLVLRALVWIFLGESSLLGRFAGSVQVALFLILALLCPLLIGAVRVGRSQGLVGLSLLFGPSLAMTATSLLGAYPLAGRLAVFQVPLWCLLIAYGYDWIATRTFASRPQTTAGALAACVIAAGLPVTGRWTVRQMQWSNSRELIALEQRTNRGREPVYINSRGVPIWALYTTDWARPDTQRLSAFIRLTEFKGPAFENASSRGPITWNEGAELVVEGPRTELVGLPTGMQLRSWSGFSQNEPDPGWLDHEVARIRAAARPRIWLCFFNSIDGAHQLLAREVVRQGGRLLHEVEGINGWLYQVEFQDPNARTRS